jgi:hypothetical protein
VQQGDARAAAEGRWDVCAPIVAGQVQVVENGHATRRIGELDVGNVKATPFAARADRLPIAERRRR